MAYSLFATRNRGYSITCTTGTTGTTSTTSMGYINNGVPSIQDSNSQHTADPYAMLRGTKESDWCFSCEKQTYIHKNGNKVDAGLWEEYSRAANSGRETYRIKNTVRAELPPRVIEPSLSQELQKETDKWLKGIEL